MRHDFLSKQYCRGGVCVCDFQNRVFQAAANGKNNNKHIFLIFFFLITTQFSITNQIQMNNDNVLFPQYLEYYVYSMSTNRPRALRFIFPIRQQQPNWRGI